MVCLRCTHALVAAGSGDLDVRLILAETGAKGKVDPAFPAHCAPIVAWATAVWEQWFPLPTLRALCNQGLKLLRVATSPWPRVKGPGTALVATAARLGWEVAGPTTMRTHSGQVLDLSRDSPAFVKSVVEEAVVRWRWRQVEARHPSMASDLAMAVAGVPAPQRQAAQRAHEREQGLGAFVQPLAKLLRPGIGRDPTERCRVTQWHHARP